MSKSAAPSFDEPTGWPEDAVRDAFVGDWFLYQRRGGHRTSTDDVLTAWFAVKRSQGRPIERYLDLGCGVGSVLLMVAHRLRPALSLGIEAQAQSALMAARSIAELPQPMCISVQHGDLRGLHGLEPFQLITGSPPYFPLGTGVLPDDAQRRACRFELRGGVEDYCQAAAPHLAAQGSLVLVFPTAGDARVLRAAEAAGLFIRARADVGMRPDRGGPFLTVYSLAREPGPCAAQALCVRDGSGELTAAYRAARHTLGLDRARAA